MPTPYASALDPIHPPLPTPRGVAGSISNDPLASPPPGAALVPIVDVTNKKTTVDDLRRATARTITQGAHGFTAGTALFNNNGTWTKAKADSLATARVDGVVSGQNLASGAFLLVSGGAIAGLSWAPNTQYYLSDATAGLLTTTAPTAVSSFLVPVARANTTSEATVNIGEPLSLAKIPDSALENPGGSGSGSGTVDNGLVAMFPRSGMPASLPAGWIECNGLNGTTDEADVGAMAVIIKHGGTVAMPVFDIPAGSYGSAQTITITCDTPSVVIKITTDGSTPSRTVGAVYTAPFIVAVGTTTVKAIAYRVPTNPTLTMIDSAIQSAVYTVAAGDTTPPTVTSVVIPALGNTLMLLFSEVVVVGGGGAAGVTLAMSGGPVTTVSASGAGTNNLNFALSRVIAAGETGTVSYAQPGNGIEDSAGNDLASFSGSAITNNSTAGGGGGAPALTSMVIPSAGTTLILNFAANVVIGAGGSGGLTMNMSGYAVAPHYVSGSGTSALTFALSRTVLSSEAGTADYTQPGNGIESAADGTDVASFSFIAITNNSTAVAPAGPMLINSVVPSAGTTLELFFNVLTTIGAGGSGGVTLTMSGGPVTVVSMATISGSSIACVLSRTILAGETGTIAYAQPGNGIEGPGGVDMASFTYPLGYNNSTQVGGGGGGLIIDEGFEGTGVPANWTNGTGLQVSDFDYSAAPLAGSQSLRMVVGPTAPESDTATLILPAAQDEFYMRFRFKTESALPAGSLALFSIQNPSFGDVDSILLLANGTVTVDFSTFTSALAADVQYHFLVHYKKGASGTGAFKVWVGTSPPTTGGSNHTGSEAVTRTAQVQYFQFQSHGANTANVFDDFQVAASLGVPTPDLLHWRLNDAPGTTIVAAVGPGSTANTGVLNNDYLAMANAAAAFQSDAAIVWPNVVTMALWFRKADWVGSDGPVRSSLANPIPRFEFFMDSGNFKPRIFGATGQIYKTIFTPFALNTWVHIALVFDNSTAAGAIKGYINGVAIVFDSEASDKTGTGNFATDQLSIKSIFAGAGQFDMDDLRIYSGETSASQIAAICFAGRP